MIVKQILENFGHIWPRHVLSLTQFLIACRRVFDGDVELFLVLCVIGERTFSQNNVHGNITYDQWNESGGQQTVAENINVQSISDFSGIPRETVRRKLGILIAKGWVERDEQGFVRATTKARIDLEPLTEISLRYLSQMKATLLKSLPPAD